MMKLATTAAAAAVMLAGLTGASTSPDAAGLTGASTSSDAARATALERSQHVRRLVERPIESHSPSENHLLGVDRLPSLATHRIVGYDNLAGVINPRNDQFRFWLAISLKGGLIESYFKTSLSETNFTGRITHGSARFRGIQGTVHVRVRRSPHRVHPAIQPLKRHRPSGDASRL